MNLLVIIDDEFLNKYEESLKKISDFSAKNSLSKIILLNTSNVPEEKFRDVFWNFFSGVEKRLYTFESSKANLVVFLKVYIVNNLSDREIFLYNANLDFNEKIFSDFSSATLEKDFLHVSYGLRESIPTICSIANFPNEFDKINFTKQIAYITKNKENKIYVDVSTLIHFDYATGIQRVVKEIVSRLNNSKYELVYSFKEHQNFYLVSGIKDNSKLGMDFHELKNSIVDFSEGDRLVFLDLHLSNAISKINRIKSLQNIGVKCYFVVYDLLPVEFPQFFVNELSRDFIEWLHAVSTSDKAICISKDVEDKLNVWIDKNIENKNMNFKSCYFHLGADFKLEKEVEIVPEMFSELNRLKEEGKNIFLMVGTIEPRKAHLEVIEAFEKNWQKGIDDILCIIGRNGWNNSDIVRKISQSNSNLIWFESVNDKELSWVYRNSTCLVAASFGEGFGLPLIEAAHYKLPIIARDIPVFREVAGNGAFYFEDNFLDIALVEWLKLRKRNEQPDVNKITYLNWEQSVASLERIINDK